MIVLRPHNWSELQHYKHRTPPWIKLHRKLLDDIKWHRLPLASKALAPMLWLIASEDKEGIIMGDEVEVSFRLRITREELMEALNPLIENGMFEDASIVLAGRLHRATSESERETETESEGDASAALARQGARGVAEEQRKLTTTEEWQRRLDQFDPQDRRKTWKPFWGPPPDQLGDGHLMPKQMISSWRAKHSNGAAA